MAQATEEPVYDVLYQWDDVEVRQYAPRIQAVTRIESSSATTSGFRRLADYIFGGNSKSMSIAMTAPVEETLGVAKPRMAFTMPAEYALEDLPVPDDNGVTLEVIQARTVAAIQFSGWASEGKVVRAEAALRSVLEERGVTVVGEASLNQYNPPWTPPFLRRNEVIVPVTINNEKGMQ